MNLRNNSDLQWIHFTDDKGRFDYPINYSGAVLSVQDDGHIDLLYRWEPDSYCHFHRHVCHTTSTVLQGELHVTDVDADGQTGEKRVRMAGDYAAKDPGDVHMEHGGPDGAVVLFHLYAPDGKLADFLGPDGEVLTTITLEDMTTGRIAQQAA
ncbi:hypothetical protein SAMN02745824_1994 [Parasphingorhabdus marina DSM 22363]|uniref:ChrR Cupin-like domain-containing protein n=1 Tax=Parasphingorhabdus marina DSM 22363 TaxID=1123272 RepID=A0A1N6ELY7_9SPHN|nr:hypothetical protein [Parasphingorhabdus marina]SIN84072.1 hypothetical protein SAMN02745824_1994 [Parasphingorhabdus marina DSM 22363]